jgi:DNA repair protein RadC
VENNNLSKTQQDFHREHRKRLRNKFLELKMHLTELEMLELALTYAVPRIDVKPLSRVLMDKFGTLGRSISSPREELLRVPGVGPETATFIQMIHALVLMGYTSKMKDVPVFKDPELLYNYCKYKLANSRIEEFHVLYLDNEGQLIEDDVHSTGTTNYAAAYPEEIFKRAVMLNSRNVIMVHNHPSGMPIFSQADMELTKATRAILSGIKAELYDHLLVANGRVFSAKSMSYL